LTNSYVDIEMVGLQQAGNYSELKATTLMA